MLGGEPSPKSHSHDVGSPVDSSVKHTVMVPGVWSALNAATSTSRTTMSTHAVSEPQSFSTVKHTV